MSIFRRENGLFPRRVRRTVRFRARNRHLTHIAPGTRLLGEVTGATELLIEGEIEGEVRVDAT